jgi:hypothetical protein
VNWADLITGRAQRLDLSADAQAYVAKTGHVGHHHHVKAFGRRT